MKNLIYLVFLILVTFAVSATIVSADVYFPKPDDNCNLQEEYVQNSEINKKKFNKIREVFFNEPSSLNKPEKGYCIDREELCYKKGCSGFIVNLRRLNSAVFHAKNIMINILINTVIVFCLYLLSKKNLRTFLSIGSFLKIGGISLLGYLADMASFFITQFIVKNFCFNLFDSLYCKGALNQQAQEKLLFPIDPISLATIGTSLFLIFFLVSLIFYQVYSNFLSTKKKKRIQFSIFFGVLSNPIWYFLLLILLSR